MNQNKLKTIPSLPIEIDIHRRFSSGPGTVTNLESLYIEQLWAVLRIELITEDTVHTEHPCLRNSLGPTHFKELSTTSRLFDVLVGILVRNLGWCIFFKRCVVGGTVVPTFCPDNKELILLERAVTKAVNLIKLLGFEKAYLLTSPRKDKRKG